MAIVNPGNKSRVKVPSEKKTKKGGPITLLSILCVMLTLLLVMTFIRFPVGTKNFNGVLGALDLDYDIEGGVAYTLELSEDNTEEVKDVEEVLDTFRYRLNELGYQTYSVKALKNTDAGVKDYAIRIEVDNYKTVNPDELEVLRAENDSSIRAVAAYGEVSILGGTNNTDANPEILTEEKAIEKAKFGGSYVDAQGTTYYLVEITFTEYGYNELISLIESAASSESATYYMGMKIGDTTLLSTSQIYADAFDGRTLVVTSQSELGAKQVALQINSGGLAYKYDIDSAISGKVDVTSPYGESVATKCVIVVVAFLILAVVAYGLLYKGFSSVVSLSLLTFILLEILMLIAVPGIKLSLGGVAGIILSLVLTGISLAYTANNIKKEFVNTEKTVKAAVKKGFKDSLMGVLNTFIVSGIVAILLLIFTIGTVKCFAITFGIGVVLGLLTSLVFSRMFSALILPLTNYNEKFFGVKRGE